MNKLTELSIKLEAAKERQDHDEEEVVQGMIDVYLDGLDAEDEVKDGSL